MNRLGTKGCIRLITHIIEEFNQTFKEEIKFCKESANGTNLESIETKLSINTFKLEIKCTEFKSTSRTLWAELSSQKLLKSSKPKRSTKCD